MYKEPGNFVLLKLISLNPKPIFEYNINENKVFQEDLLLLSNLISNSNTTDIKEFFRDIILNDFLFEFNDIKEDKLNKDNNLFDFNNLIIILNDENFIIPVKDDNNRKLIIMFDRKNRNNFSLLFLINEFYYCKFFVSKTNNNFYNINVKSNLKKYLINLKENYEKGNFLNSKYRNNLKVVFNYETEGFSNKI